MQLVKLIQDHAEEWLGWVDELPPLNQQDMKDPEDSLYLSDEQMEEMKDHPLYDIVPYFLYGKDEDFIAIIQRGSDYDIHINGEIVASLAVFQETDYKVVSGTIDNSELLTEISRRIKAIRAL